MKSLGSTGTEVANCDVIFVQHQRNYNFEKKSSIFYTSKKYFLCLKNQGQKKKGKLEKCFILELIQFIFKRYSVWSEIFFAWKISVTKKMEWKHLNSFMIFMYLFTWRKTATFLKMSGILSQMSRVIFYTSGWMIFFASFVSTKLKNETMTSKYSLDD